MAKINEIEVNGTVYDLEDKKLTDMIQNTHQNGTQLKEPVVGTGYSNEIVNSTSYYICNDGNRFIALAGYGRGPYESEDGINWVELPRSGSSLISVYSIIYANGYYLAGGSYPDNSPTSSDIIYSEDALNWKRAGCPSGDRMPINDIIYIDSMENFSGDLGVYIGVGSSGLCKSYTNSPVGGFIKGGTSYNLPTISLNSITYGKGVVVAVGDGGAVYSTDGKEWLNCSGLSYTMNKVIFNKDRFIAAGNGGAFYESNDGINWVMLNTFGTSYTIDSICYGNGLFISAYHSNSQSDPAAARSYFKYSYDGIIWTGLSNGNLPVGRTMSIYYAGGKFILGGYKHIDCISFDQVTKSLPSIVDDLSGEVYTTIPNRLNNIESKFTTCCIRAITTSNWVESTTYTEYPYQYETSVTEYIDIYPIWSLSHDDTLPTDEDYSNFSKIGLMKFDVDNMKLIFYASEIPTTMVYILIKGVK